MKSNFTVSNGSVAYRGCMSDDLHGKRFCSEYAKQCRECTKHKCNDDSIVWRTTVSQILNIFLKLWPQSRSTNHLIVAHNMLL